MTYKTGTWGVKAKARAKKRNAYFYEYNKRRDPIKKRARVKTWLALLSDKLQRMPCEVCGEIKVQAHHDDYEKPLQVRWLCHIHHREADKKVR